MSKIRAIIFDLDDTLYDCTGSLTESARRRAAKAMVESGLPLTEEEAYDRQVEIAQRFGPRSNVFDRIAEDHGLGRDFIQAALDAYNSDVVSDIHLFPDVEPALRDLRRQGYFLFLVTTGVHRRQEKKIDLLGVRYLFDEIVINDSELGSAREERFRDLIERYGLAPTECVAVGDRLHSEIRAGNYLKMTTVQMLHGKYRTEAPKNELEEPDFRITRISQLPEALAAAGRVRRRPTANIVAIGGGTGLPIVIEGLKSHTSSLAAIVATTDSGRSSGRLRRSLGVLPPGDARNCLIAMTNSRRAEKLLYDLFQYRFDKGELEGMSFGNLFLAALEKMTGSFQEALNAASNILAIEGAVLPAALTDTHICARLADGSVVREEFNIRGLGKAPIEEVFLDPADVRPSEQALERIAEADIIVLGPGSLYTSVITNLLVPGFPRAIRQTRAVVVYVCNIVTQPGQTDGYMASDHTRAVIRYLGEGVLDHVIVNNCAPDEAILAPYRADNAELVEIDEALSGLGANVIEADIVEAIDEKRILWEKQDLLRHDPQKLAEVIMTLR